MLSLFHLHLHFGTVLEGLHLFYNRNSSLLLCTSFCCLCIKYLLLCRLGLSIQTHSVRRSDMVRLLYLDLRKSCSQFILGRWLNFLVRLGRSHCIWLFLRTSPWCSHSYIWILLPNKDYDIPNYDSTQPHHHRHQPRKPININHHYDHSPLSYRKHCPTCLRPH